MCVGSVCVCMGGRLDLELQYFFCEGGAGRRGEKLEGWEQDFSGLEGRG